MKEDKFESFLGQTKQEIDELIAEKGTVSCIDCPNARLKAAETLRRQKSWQKLAGNFERYGELAEEQGASLVESELEFDGLINNCSAGYREVWSPDSPNPAKMCNSDFVDHYKISIMAGRILETLDWVMPPILKKLLGR